ncbi:hypothetical protein FNJ88_06405 [Chryseobacterium sp. SNU WT5]|uniref:hypothetical protein n=1 Tax=Chryseobacterium sp. SNU WT5 TaxID=2594269 RepID=UPI00117EBD7C|nr:hypothetical protein [Chryseobacterium sp. SNU WT5]QDP85214.1 hypothetical protein FNJ88_06405 [Chryseobacterium sp. SNU WT5]
MKINDHEYSKEEVLAALKKKGYLILKHTFHDEEHVHGSRFIKHHYTTECALKGRDLPEESNQWQKVAENEFQQINVKPPLV